MRILRGLFRTRNRVKALEDFLGVYFNSDWDEYENRERGLVGQLEKRVRYLEDKKLTKKERESISRRLY